MKTYNACPKCGKENKHEWAKTIQLRDGYFVIKCVCGKTYTQALVGP